MPAVKTTIASFPTTGGTDPDFPTTGGTDPDGQLFIDSNGDLFGATVHGGTAGTTYEIAKIAGSYASTPTFLADIPGTLNTLVGVPNLSADVNGDLFGLMFSGGTNTLGTVVEFPASGGPEVQLANFTGGAGGSNPGGILLVDASGNLFGTTLLGGAHNAGTVFEVKKTGGTYATAPTVLTSFNSGITPSGSGNLVEDAAGNLFGTTTSSVFEVKKTGATYGAPVELVPFPVGTQIGSLTIDAKGDIFGTTITGGENDDGTVFEIEKTPGGYASAPTTLASFVPADGKLSLNRPKTLIVDANGDLFGTTDPSAQNSGGVVFEIVRIPTGYESMPTIVSDFNGLGDGSLGANLVVDANGNLFGTTQAGGVNNKGSAFEITDSGFATTPTVVPILSSLLWQNINTGQASIWAMDGITKTGGGAVTPNPGTAWRAVGTGAFFIGLLALGVFDTGTAIKETLVLFILPYAALSFGLGYCAAFPKLTRGNDLSYGIFLLGFPIQQTITALIGAQIGPWANFFIAIIISAPLAYLSWNFIEQPMLSWKPTRRRDRAAASPMPAAG